MSEIINAFFENADYALLIMLRVAGLVWPNPILGRQQMPALSKIGLMLTLTVLFYILYPPGPNHEIVYSTVFGFAARCAGEVLFGLVIGVIVNLFLSLPYIGGQLIDMQLGFGMVNVYDPQNNTQVPVVGSLLNMMLIIIFFLLDGQHMLIEILSDTFEYIPAGQVKFAPEIGLVALELFCKAFALGLTVGMPLIASGLTLEILFGTLIRSVPQMNMFVVGMPIKTVVGLVVLLVTLPAFATFSNTIFSEMFAGIDKIFATIMVSGY